MPLSQKLIPKNTSFFIPQSEKYIMRNGIIISVLLIKVIFLQVNKYIFQLTKYEHKDIRESIDSDDTNLSSLVLRNNHSLNALNFRRF